MNEEQVALLKEIATAHSISPDLFLSLTSTERVALLELKFKHYSEEIDVDDRSIQTLLPSLIALSAVLVSLVNMYSKDLESLKLPVIAIAILIIGIF